MGYYVNLVESDFGIPETKEVLGTLIEADVLFHDVKRGGSSSGDKWFSWVSKDYATNIKSVNDFFQGELGFSTDVKDGKVWLTGYESKTGQEDLFIALVAPYVSEGSFVSWEGEDGEFWQNVKIGDKLQTRKGVKSYGELEEYCFHSFNYNPVTRLPDLNTMSYTEITELSVPKLKG